MGGVRLGLQQVAPTRVVERVHLSGIAGERLGGGEPHGIEARPNACPSLVAKRAQPAFGRVSCARQHEDVHWLSSAAAGSGVGGGEVTIRPARCYILISEEGPCRS